MCPLRLLCICSVYNIGLWGKCQMCVYVCVSLSIIVTIRVRNCWFSIYIYCLCHGETNCKRSIAISIAVDYLWEKRALQWWTNREIYIRSKISKVLNFCFSEKIYRASYVSRLRLYKCKSIFFVILMLLLIHIDIINTIYSEAKARFQASVFL